MERTSRPGLARAATVRPTVIGSRAECRPEAAAPLMLERPASSLIDRITSASLRHPWKFLATALALALAGGGLASRLEVRSSFAELLPSDMPSVRLLHELIRRVGGDGTVLVMVEAEDGPEGLPRAEAMAQVLARDYLALGGDLIRSVEWTMKPIEAWYADHWPMFIPLRDLEQARDAVKTAKARGKQRLLDLGLEDEAPQRIVLPPGPVRELIDPAKPPPREQVAARFARYRDGFLVHPDGRSVTLVVRPTGTSLGIDETRDLLARMRATADRHAPELRAEHLRVAFGGTFPALLVEYESILRDVASTFLLVVAIVLGSLLLFFRDLRSVAALGAAILRVALKRHWVLHDLDSRALEVTSRGRREMLTRFGLRL